MINRWGTDVRKGMTVTAHLPRGGTVTGIVEKIEREAGRGKVATLDSGCSVCIDDVIARTYKLVWSPSQQHIVTVRATSAKDAIRKAPMPYSKYRGEIHADEVQS